MPSFTTYGCRNCNRETKGRGPRPPRKMAGSTTAIMVMKRKVRGINVKKVNNISSIQREHNVVVEAVAPPEKDNKDYPEDLHELVSSKDAKPERELEKLVDWLKSPLDSPTQNHTIARIHALMWEWSDSIENKMEHIRAWLLEEPFTTEPQSDEVISPKVVVEAQPEPLDCWTSMADNEEIKEP